MSKQKWCEVEYKKESDYFFFCLHFETMPIEKQNIIFGLGIREIKQLSAAIKKAVEEKMKLEHS